MKFDPFAKLFLLQSVLMMVVYFCAHNSRLVDASEIPNATLTSSNDSETQEIVRKWRVFEKQVKKMSSSIFKSALPFMLRASEDINLTAACKRGLMKWLNGVKQMKLWAYHMIDASGKIPVGMLGTNLNAVGDYDMCLNTEVPNHFQGQYCTIAIVFPLPKRRPFTSLDMDLPEFINFSDPSTVPAYFVRNAQVFYILNFRSSLCVPSTCNEDDVHKISSAVMKSMELEFDVDIVSCEYKKSVVLSTDEIVIICVLSVIVMMGITSTTVDVILHLRGVKQAFTEKSLLLKCLLCFSFYTNTMRLLKKDDSPDTIKIFHGMKVITILWVILNHNFLYVNHQTLGNIPMIHIWRRRISFQLIANGFLNVGTFFFISAVLIAYATTKIKAEKLGAPFVCLYIFRRLWRLTPPFMFVIATSFLVPHIGSGPMWQETVVEGLINKCKKYWWTNLLYFNNFIPFRETCFSWMWYIPTDTHLYILSLLVIIPLKRNVRNGFIMNGILFATGIAVTIANHIYYNLQPTAITAFSHHDDTDYFADYGYFRSYLHITTYCVGMTVGHLIATRKCFRIPLIFNIAGWFLAFLLPLIFLYGVYDWNQGNVPGLAVSTLYACTNKVVWSLALGWVTVACMTGNGGIAYNILSWQAFVPLSRLTYMVYLIHPITHFVYLGSARNLTYADDKAAIYLYLGTVMLAFLIAYPCSLLFESPFMALEKVLLSPKKLAEKDDSTVEKEMENGKAWKSIHFGPKSGTYAVHVREDNCHNILKGQKNIISDNASA